MNGVYLLLGSNLGDRESYITGATNLLAERVGTVEVVSSYYETASWGKTEQPDFINQAIYLQTNLSPQELLITILDIEKQFGRQRIEKWGSRTIDIDILFYADMIIKESDLVVPHPYLHERAFALLPLAEIAPEYVHPLMNKTILDLCDSLADDLSVKRIDARN